VVAMLKAKGHENRFPLFLDLQTRHSVD
jgi:hypothetical protein